MQLNRNAKQNGITGAIAVITIIAHAWLAVFSGGEIEYANLVELRTPGLNVAAILDAAGKDIVPIEIHYEATLTGDSRLEVMGGLPLDAKPGDVLIFRKDNGVWVEVGRYLTEG